MIKRVVFILFSFALMLVIFCQTAKSAEDSAKSDSFVGEKITWPEKVSKNLKNININVTFPEGYKFLDEAHPYVKLVSTDDKLIQDAVINEFPFQLKLSKKIPSAPFFINLGIYYCREKGVAMCLRKNVLYQVDVDDASKIESMNIAYQIKDEGY